MNEDTKQIVEDIKTSVAKTVTEEVLQNLDAKFADRKSVFGEEKDTNAELREQKEEAANALKKLAAGEVKALTTGGSTSGAEVVPTVVSSDIVRVAQNVGLVRRYGRTWPMQSSKENVPTLGSVSAYRVNEGAKITSSQPTTGSVALSSKTVGVIIPMSRKLLQNASIQVLDAITMLAGEAIALLEDKWAILGLGNGEGVFQHANVPGVTMATGDVTYAKATPEYLLDVIDKVDDNISDDRLRWVLSRSVLNSLRKQRAAVGSDKQGFLFQGFGSDLPPTMWNIPYSLHSMMPKTSGSSQADKKFAALVNFDNIIYGDEQKYTIELSEQATITDTDGTTLINLFEQNMVAVKVSGEIDIQIAEPTKSAAWLKTAAS
jgi:HK97 family phage major capsid protein